MSTKWSVHLTATMAARWGFSWLQHFSSCFISQLFTPFADQILESRSEYITGCSLDRDVYLTNPFTTKSKHSQTGNIWVSLISPHFPQKPEIVFFFMTQRLHVKWRRWTIMGSELLSQTLVEYLQRSCLWRLLVFALSLGSWDKGLHQSLQSHDHLVHLFATDLNL